MTENMNEKSFSSCLPPEHGNALTGVEFNGNNLTVDQTVAILNELIEENRLLKLGNGRLNISFNNVKVYHNFVEDTVKAAVEHERTDLGRNVLVQLAENLGVEIE